MTGDPWASYTKDPSRPKPQKDWSKASWGDVAWEGAKNLFDSYSANMAKAIEGLPGQAEDVARAMVNPAMARSPMSRLLATAAVPQFAVAQDIRHPGPRLAQRALDAVQAAKGIQQHIATSYTNPGALKRTIATNPGGALMDVQGVTGAMEGGLGALGDLPGAAGRIARGAQTGVGAFNRGTNPAALAGETLAAGSKGLQRAVRGGSPLDRAGNFTPAARNAVSQAFPNGEIGDAELNSPGFKSALAQTFRAKGISPEAAKEAVLRYNGAPTPASVIARRRPAPQVAPAAQEASADAARAIAQRVQRVTGAPEPDASALGSALQRAHQASEQNVSALYRKAAQTPGTFHPVFSDILRENVQKALQGENLPSTPEEMAKFPSYKQSRDAYDFLNGHISDLAETNGLTFPAVERARQELNALWKGAKGNDAYAISAMKGALDKSIEDVLTHSVPEGAPVDFTPEDFAQAREASAQHRARFENRDTANPAIVSALKKAEGPGPDIEGEVDPALATGSAAQAALSRALLGTKGLQVQPGGAKLYSDLSSVLDDEGRQALADHVRQSILRVGDDGSLVAKPAQIRDFLDSPLGKLFTPEEQSDLRLSAAGQDVLNARPPYAAVPPEAGGAIGPLFRRGLGMAAAAAGAYFSPLHHAAPVTAELGSALLAGTLERQLEPLFQARQINRELSGVPATGAALDVPAAAGSTLSAVARAVPVARALQGHPDAPKALEPVRVPDVGLSTIPGPFDGQVAPTQPNAEHQSDPWARYLATPAQENDTEDFSTDAGPFGADREGHASGGKVGQDIEPLVQKLLKLAKEAKKTSNRATEPLLSASDNAVAKALEIAQRHI